MPLDRLRPYTGLLLLAAFMAVSLATFGLVVVGKTLTAVLFVALYAVSLRPARPTQPPR